MRNESLQFLRDLVSAPSPSGFEQPAQRVVREYASAFADEVRTDVHGNVIAVKNPGVEPRVMLAGHVDQIGLMVRFVTDEGFVHCASIGGVDPAILPGARVVVHGKQGPVPGVIGRKAIHLTPPEDRGKALQMHDLWVDIGARRKQEAEKLVAVGDPITLDVPFLQLRKDLVAAPGFDDKVGAFVVMEALRLLKGARLKCGVYAVSTVQEEVGLRGAVTSTFGIAPQAGVAVDVTHAADYPGAEKKMSGDIRLGRGPAIARGANINPAMERLLLEAANEAKIPVQLEAAPGGTGTDANAMQLSRGGVATGLVAIPNRYMHSPSEVVSLSDLGQCAKLLAATMRRIGPETDFTPV